MSGLRWLIIMGTLTLTDAPAALAAGPFQFYSLTPCRIADTRNPSGVLGGPALTAGWPPRNFPISASPASCGVPATATAAALNVTMVSVTDAGFLTIWPFLTAMPGVSNINANAGEVAIANSALVPLTSDPNFNISVIYGTAGGGTTHVVIDVTGFYQ